MNPDQQVNQYFPYMRYGNYYYPPPPGPFGYPPYFMPMSPPINQINHETGNGQNSVKKEEEIPSQKEVKEQKVNQVGLKKKKVQKDQLYNPKKKYRTKKISKIYERDDNRNIIPNIINQVFSFLEKRFKSEKAVGKMIQIHQQFLECQNVVQKFYLYQMHLKSKLTRHRNEGSIKMLFDPVDTACEFFTHQDQQMFIKMNAIMIRHFFKSQIHILQVLTGKKINKDKLQTYLSALKRIKFLVFSEIEAKVEGVNSLKREEI